MMWQSRLPRVCRIAERPSASIPAKAWRAAADRAPGDEVGDVLRRDRVEELAADRQARAEHLEQETAGHAQARVDVAGAVEVGIVDQALPADGRPRLLEVHAHHHEQVVGEPFGLGAQLLGVLACGLDVVDAAGADDDHQPVIVAIEHGVRAGTPVEQRGYALVIQRQLVEELLWGDQRDETLDSLIADGITLVGADHGHHARLFLWRFMSRVLIGAPLTVRKQRPPVTPANLRGSAARHGAMTAGARLLLASSARLRPDERGVRPSA
jgi:hypothetical protein